MFKVHWGGGGGQRSEECPMGGAGGGNLLIEYHSVLFYSSDGIGRTGTFCATYSMMDRVKVEQVVDAFQTIKSRRIQRAGLLDSLVYCGHGLLCLCFPSQLCHHMFRKHCCICRVSMFTDLETDFIKLQYICLFSYLFCSPPPPPTPGTVHIPAFCHA